MDDLQFSWYTVHDHDHQVQSFDFDSENMFSNRTHQLSPIDWADQAIIAPHDLVCSNGFQDIKNAISGDLYVASAAATSAAAATVLERLPSSTNSSSDESNRVSVIYSDHKSLGKCNNTVTRNNNSSGASSGDSVTDDGIASQYTSGKRPFNCVGGSENVTLFKPKRSRSHVGQPISSNINFQQPGNPSETDVEAIAQMKEMIYREAAFRPVSFAAEIAVEKPRRKNVRISSDPQTVAARQRRERISERIRVLQKLVPGGNKMDTASMLDEAANYLKFLRSQVKALEQLGQNITTINPQESLVVPFNQNPFLMHTHYQFGHENLYPNPPPA